MNLRHLFSPRRSFSPHDFVVASHVAEPPPEPKKLGLTHCPRVRTTYPDIAGHFYPSPVCTKLVHNSLVKLKKETTRKLT